MALWPVSVTAVPQLNSCLGLFRWMTEGLTHTPILVIHPSNPKHKLGCGTAVTQSGDVFIPSTITYTVLRLYNVHAALHVNTRFKARS